ncbi:MAG: hypothetical protein NVSMB47_21280 [Polyangiales bacterium]
MAPHIYIAGNEVDAESLARRLRTEGHSVQVLSSERARALGLEGSANGNGNGNGHAPQPNGHAPTLETVARAAYEEAERRAIVEALARFSGNRTRAAADLHVSRSTLWQKLRRYGLAEGPPPASSSQPSSSPSNGA